MTDIVWQKPFGWASCREGLHDASWRRCQRAHRSVPTGHGCCCCSTTVHDLAKRRVGHVVVRRGHVMSTCGMGRILWRMPVPCGMGCGGCDHDNAARPDGAGRVLACACKAGHAACGMQNTHVNLDVHYMCKSVTAGGGLQKHC